MELTQLRYFFEVYRTGNICEAANRLKVSQQAVSKQIKNLEEELGVDLFGRTPRGVKATVYADGLAEKVQEMLPELDAFVYDLKNRGTEAAGVVRLGIQCWQMSVGHVLRYDVLKGFGKAFPRVKLLWENTTPPIIREGLKSGAFDLAVTGMPEDPEPFELTPLRRSRWYMLMSSSHPLAGKKKLSVEDLAGRKIIIAEDEMAARNGICRKLTGREMPVFIDVRGFLFDLIGQQIEGEEAMMLTTGTVLELFNPGKFKMVPLEDGFLPTQLYLVRLKEKAPAPAERALYQYLLDNWGRETQQKVVTKNK